MKTVKLTAGGYEAVILPEFGANCISLKHLATGASLLREPETEQDFLREPIWHGMPLLFPPNRIQDAKFDFAGKTYHFSLNEPERMVHVHGELSHTEFETVSAGENKAVFRFRAPYFDYQAICLEIAYVLDEEGLHQTVTVTNESEETIPVGLGYHTAVPLPFLPGGKPEDIVLQGSLGAEYGRDPERLLTQWEPLPDSEVHKAIEAGTLQPYGKWITVQYLCGEDRTVRVIDKATGIAVVYEISDTYASWMFWKLQDSKFLCLEPQSWLGNTPYAPDPIQMGLQVIPPQGNVVFSTRMYLTTP